MTDSDKIPFEQCACVYKNEKFIAFEPLSGYRMWLPEDEDRTSFLRPDAEDQDLGKALLSALSLSRFIDPPLDENSFFKAERYVKADQIWHQQVMARFEFRSLRHLYESMRFCKVSRSEGAMSIKPHQRDAKPRYWWDLPPEATVVIAATLDAKAVGAALNLALSRCE